MAPLSETHGVHFVVNEDNNTGEVRSTSETGGEKGVKPQRMSLLPFQALAKISEVYGFGEKKYAAHNWRKGYEWDKSIDALERHIGEFKDGKDLDPESGLPHLAHAAFHIFTLLVFMLNPKRYKRFDNRWSTVEDREAKTTLMIKPPTSVVGPEWGWQGKMPGLGGMSPMRNQTLESRQ